MAGKPKRGHSCWSIGLKCEFPKRAAVNGSGMPLDFTLAFPESPSWWICQRCGFATRRPDLYEITMGLPRVKRRYLDKRFA